MIHYSWIIGKLNLNQRRIKMAHFNSLGSDTSEDLKRAPRRSAVLNLHWYKPAIWEVNDQNKSKTIVGEIPTIDFTFFLIF